MTQAENSKEVIAVREAYAALNRNDIDGFVAILDPEIERVEFPELPSGGTYRGLEAFKKHFVQGRSTWAEGSCEPERLVVKGDKVVVSVRVHVRLKNHTEWIDAHIADVFTFRDGKAVQFYSFVEEYRALEWVDQLGHNR